MSKHKPRNLTMLERKTCIELLKKAKNKLERYEQRYICDAIYMSELDMRHTQVREDMGMYLRKWVMNGLEGNGAYGGWVIKRHPKKTMVNAKEFHTQVRKARIAWVEWMIIELEQGR